MKKRLLIVIAAILSLFAVLFGCSFHLQPEYTEIFYSVTGTATNVTITAVMDEHETLQTFPNVSLPWSKSYENETHELYPPIYLKVEVTAAPAAVLSGTTTSTVAEQLIDAAATFQTSGVQVGDIAQVSPGGAFSAIAEVTSETTLKMTTGDDFFPLGTAYDIFKMRDISSVVSGTDPRLGRKAAPVNIKNLSIESWATMGATVIAKNYTAP
jgi:hypothetical protein